MNARYRPGVNAALISDDLVVITAEPGLLRALATTPATSVLGVVAALGGGDLAALPEFCCLLREADGIRIVVRGGYVVDTGLEEWGGQGVATWTERLLPADAGVRMSTAGAAGELLPVGSGSVVLVSEVVWGVLATPDAERVVVPDQVEGRVAPPPEPEAEQPGAPAARGERVAASGAPADPAATRLEDEDDFDAMFGATVAGRRPEDAAVRDLGAPDQGYPAPGSAPLIAGPPGTSPHLAPAGQGPAAPTPPVDDHDGRTVMAASVSGLRGQTPPAAVPTLPPVPVAATPSVRLSTGERFVLDRPLLLGRAPRSTPGASTQVPTIHVIADPYISSTHLQVAVEAGAVMATDLSTNGTLLARAGRTPERLPRSVATLVRPGDVLQLSEELELTVEEPA